MLRRGFRYRLYPTAEQARLMEHVAGATRFVYNLALEQRRDFWRQARASGIVFNHVSQGREVTQLRRECDWLRAAPADALAQALRDLDKAFSNFFTGRARYPNFRSKLTHMGFRVKGRDTTVRDAGTRFANIGVPSVGRVKMRLSRPMRGRPVSTTFNKDALGWHACVVCEIEHEAPANDLPQIGIDRGIANTLALSNGEMVSVPDTSILERRKRKAQRVLARRKRGSHRYRKQRQRVALLSAKLARVRKGALHMASTGIAQRFGTVALEALNIVAMASGPRKRYLNRSIREQGWGMFETLLSYKLEERGGTLVKVHPAYTSQECSACGVIDKASRESQARYACRHCGFTGHADTNAAKNILRRHTAVVEGSAYAPVEARTRTLAA